MLTLPPRRDGSRGTIDADGSVIIVGANGSGKSRFTARLRADLGERAFALSALHGLFDREWHDPGATSIDGLYSAMPSADIYTPPTSQLDKLMRLLVNEEISRLMSYKLKGDRRRLREPQGETRLDRTMEVWRDIFPGNEILLENGRLMLSRSEGESSSAGYSPQRLSSGEKAVMYYTAGLLYAPEGATVFVDDPAIFLHPSVATALWNRLEALRPDCRMVYTTHDLDFASSRAGAATVWVRDYDAATHTWDYDLLPADSGLTDDIYLAILGARRPVLFIEGDGVNSIDAKLYPLIFKGYTIKSLGSCNKVIESVRTFNDLRGFHHLDSHGIVDRDRRDASEVAYLRRRGIFVPEVAEIENILMLEDVIRAVASHRGKDEETVFGKVKKSVLGQFRTDLRRQALLHTRHRVKRIMEYRVDGRFNSIGALEDHIGSLVREINPRALYEEFCREFNGYLRDGDYASVLRVYNQKSMLPGSNVAGLCGLRDKGAYLRAILDLLREDGSGAERVRQAILRCFSFEPTLVPDTEDDDTPFVDLDSDEPSYTADDETETD
ncbi:MAG: DUF4435 domain-containing protein [Candidatus Amulumruptor caecigallinarius]|nr:DUF4435 domain-containing protein [Candidatus Amulumruptor caecigallinarius]MCM1396572.1 DUF4435 domain-containing protein [Candidatus Amulumruptor caecigallinarius]MCM1453370.1 DUF4435 domain-containing protein [bacterium]